MREHDQRRVQIPVNRHSAGWACIHPVGERQMIDRSAGMAGLGRRREAFNRQGALQLLEPGLYRADGGVLNLFAEEAAVPALDAVVLKNNSIKGSQVAEDFISTLPAPVGIARMGTSKKTLGFLSVRRSFLFVRKCFLEPFRSFRYRDRIVDAQTIGERQLVLDTEIHGNRAISCRPKSRVGHMEEESIRFPDKLSRSNVGIRRKLVESVNPERMLQPLQKEATVPEAKSDPRLLELDCVQFSAKPELADASPVSFQLGEGLHVVDQLGMDGLFHLGRDKGEMAGNRIAVPVSGVDDFGVGITPSCRVLEIPVVEPFGFNEDHREVTMSRHGELRSVDLETNDRRVTLGTSGFRGGKGSPDRSLFGVGRGNAAHLLFPLHFDITADSLLTDGADRFDVVARIPQMSAVYDIFTHAYSIANRRQECKK